MYAEMLHTKSIVIDDDWATVGSANMDNYSFFFNYELNIISVDKKFIEDVRKQFELDIMKSLELTHEQWKKRPFHQKVLEVLSTPFARFL